MEKIKLRLLQEIFGLSRDIQANNRVYYKSRIIEFLTDYLIYPSKSKENTFIQWLDSSDKVYYSKLFVEKLDYPPTITNSMEDEIAYQQGY